jgi:YVTN family beta-propeller protein
VVYVTCEGENDIAAIDTTTLAVIGRVKTGARPRAIVFTSDGKTGFVTSENGGVVTTFDTATHGVSTTIQMPKIVNSPTAARPMGAALSPDNAQLYVSLGRAKAIAIIDVGTRKVARIIEDVGARPWGIGLSADGKQLYTANGPSGDVSVVDIASGKTEKRIPVGGSPWGIAVKPAS